MPLYTVHEPPRGLAPLERARRMAFVREGFSWGAFLVPVIWLVWRRMWWILAVYVAAALVFVLFMRWWSPPPGTAFLIGLALSFLFGLEANGLRRGSLGRRHWRQVGLAVGADRVMAEHAFFTRWLARPELATPDRQARA